MFRSIVVLRVLILGGFVAVAPHGAAAGVTQVFIVAGQSNALGTASPSGLPTSLTNQEDVLFWRGLSPVSARTTFRSLRPIGTFGPELNAGRVLADTLSDDIAIVKLASSASQLAQIGGASDWSPNSSRELYASLIDNVNAATAALTDEGRTPRIAGMFWMQGETDGKSGTLGGGRSNPPQPATANAYEANLSEFIARVRTDLSLPELPVFIGEINIGDDPSITTDPDSDYNTFVGEWDFTPTIQAAQRSVADAVDNAYLIETDQFSNFTDYLHFDQAGQLALGEAFATAYLATVPEPSSFALLLTCLGAIPLFSRRNSNRSAGR